MPLLRCLAVAVVGLASCATGAFGQYRPPPPIKPPAVYVPPYKPPIIQDPPTIRIPEIGTPRVYADPPAVVVPPPAREYEEEPPPDVSGAIECDCYRYDSYGGREWTGKSPQCCPQQ